MLGFKGAEVTQTPGIGLPRKDCISVFRNTFKNCQELLSVPLPRKGGWMDEVTRDPSAPGFLIYLSILGLCAPMGFDYERLIFFQHVRVSQ